MAPIEDSDSDILEEHFKAGNFPDHFSSDDPQRPSVESVESSEISDLDASVPESADGDDDDEDPTKAFELTDFEPPISEEELAKFNTAYGEFVRSLQARAELRDVEPVILGRPNHMKPLPQTAADFDERMPFVMVPYELVDERDELEDRLEVAAEFQLDGTITSANSTQIVTAQSQAQLNIFEDEFRTIEEGMGDDKTWALQKLVLLAEVLFEEEIAGLVYLECTVAQTLALLKKMSTMFKTILEEDNAALKINDRERQSLNDFLALCKEDLTEGGLVVPEFVDQVEFM